MFDRPAASACGNVNGLMLEVFNEPQIFEAAVSLVTVDVVRDAYREEWNREQHAR